MKRSILGSLLLIVALAGVVWAQAPKAPQASQATPAPAAIPELPDLLPGEGWQELVVPAHGDLMARAWNDPAAGCSLASLQIPIPATAQLDPLAEAVHKVMAGKALSATEQGREGESLRFFVSGESVQGHATLKLNRQSPTLGDSNATLLACYWNQREPEQCAAICQRVLDNPTTESP